jgi:riboflavin biosynthesis pyrimidine reductase
VSRSKSDLPGATVVASPGDAVRHLEQQGFGSALVGGGDSLLNAFLAEGLADEIIFNITPEIGGPGNHVSLSGLDVKPLKLHAFRDIGEGIIRVHYILSD